MTRWTKRFGFSTHAGDGRNDVPRLPYRARWWIGSLLVLAGILGVIAWVFVGLARLDDDVDGFVRARPGKPTEFTLDEPVSWTVYIEPEFISLGSARIDIFDVASGERVPLRPYGGSLEYSTFGHSGRAVATVSLPAGEYRLFLESPVGRTVALGRGIGGRLATTIVGAIVLGVVVIGAGAVILVLTGVAQSRARNRASVPPPSTWSSGEWEPPPSDPSG